MKTMAWAIITVALIVAGRGLDVAGYSAWQIAAVLTLVVTFIP